MGRPGGARLSEDMPSLLGVRLDQYAGVTAALAEGLPMREVLEQEQLTPEGWAPADRAWKEAFVEAPDLHLRYTRLRRQAEDCLSRRVDPLDDDAAAWAGLLGALALSDDPERMIGALGLRMVDVGRIGRAWRGRAEKDPAVADRLAKLAGKSKAPASLRCGATVLRPFPWTPPPRSKERPAPPPPSLPESMERAPATLPEASFFLPEPEPMAPPLLVPADRAPPSPPRLHTAPPPFSETLGVPSAPATPVLPFGERPSAAFLEELVSGPPTSAPVQSGETLGVGPAALKVSQVLPFSGRGGAEPAGAPGQGGAKTQALGETMAISAGAPRSQPLPFDMAGKPEEPYGLTLQQYASLWAELAMYPERVGAVLRRYGLPDEEARKKLNEAWGRRFLKEPAMRRSWMELCARYREWLQKQGNTGG